LILTLSEFADLRPGLFGSAFFVRSFWENVDFLIRTIIKQQKK